MSSGIDLKNFKNKVIFQKLEESQDEFGNIISNFINIKNTWTSVEMLSYQDLIIYARKDIKVNYKLTTRFDLILFQAKRAIYNNKILKIEHITHDIAKKYMEASCREII